MGYNANIKEWVAANIGLVNPQLIKVFTTPYISIQGITSYNYTFKWEGDEVGYASFWIVVYRDSLDYNKLIALTLLSVEGSGLVQIMTWNNPMLELFYGYRFSAKGEDLKVTNAGFAEYVTKIKNESSIYEKITALNGNYSEDIFEVGVGYPDSIAFKNVDLTNLDKEKSIYYTYVLGNNVTWEFCYADAIPFSEISCKTSSIKEVKQISSLNIYPNPTTENATVSFELETACNVKIILSNVLGQELIQVYDGFADTGFFIKTINTNHLPKGVYLLKVLIGGNYTVEKIVVN